MTIPTFITRDDMMEHIESLGFRRSGQCHDDRNRDAIYRMIEDFRACATCNPSDEFVRNGVDYAHKQIERQYQYDQTEKITCKHC